ncbi:MAG: GTPase ObgE [Verrucomicrobiaceae bacterium]|nr:GTPase ObgE [Verrucomicrobiaceae bacterium]
MKRLACNPHALWSFCAVRLDPRLVSFEVVILKKRQFVDHIRVFARAGDGGNGVVHFRREKYVPKGGPDGGDGGDGGDVILKAAMDTDNLTDLFYRSRLIAPHGEHGAGRQKKGRSGNDLVVKVPPGTIVFRLADKDQQVDAEDEKLEPVADLAGEGETFVIAKAGIGGKGNVSFKSPTNQAPQEFTPGTTGESGYFFLELRKIADAGLVGFPNAGKSTLLGAVSAAKPKVASYPFTTLQPSVGVVEFKGFSRATVADIPGLIEGAHANVGLGHDFLRHIMRCRLLLFVVDIAATEDRDPVDDLQTLRKEINLYNEELAARPWVVVANKMDIEGAEAQLAQLQMRFPKAEIIPVSAQCGDGMELLKERLSEIVGAPVC